MRARLLSVSRQVGAHLWHEDPARGLSGIRTHNLLTLTCLEVQTLPLSYLLVLVAVLVLMPVPVLSMHVLLTVLVLALILLLMPRLSVSHRTDSN